jgi:transposase
VQRTRRHEKVSVIAALLISPGRHRVRFCFRLHPEANIDTRRICAFLTQLRRMVRSPVVLIWDRLQAHRCPRMRAFAQQRRIHLEWLPPYAPELNPVEYSWCWLKHSALANYAAPDAPQLARVARGHARHLQHCPSLLWSFIEHSPLSLRHT